VRPMLFICRYCWNVATYKLKVRNEKIEVISFVCRSDSFLTGPSCQCPGGGQGILSGN